MEGKRGSECLLKPVLNIDFNPIPKERKIETVSAKELDQINHWINARPMKTLNWQSPRKVFQQFAVFG
ncbi:hypothetical protein BMS70_04890 [Leuconostoc mesenteroides subsp. cremoris]|nr:hypothetical protein LMT8_04295 [Leuconostoc mesenteroides subsp. cremoris TIFN8]KDA52024.1 Mobile element protein [Leuconostoc mesenteroides subsp. cremoris T26]ORI37834.1 hypothetical protein BMR90_05085 [Leuconostoc mesenteroides subsp. cremoris]ORI38209.1 hypothetical protein BMR89_04855 [Leuconostoc mesenteroides subsp. cremoris]ORI41286.1 hypothetical protein BMR91_04725 [Leuconostoc mesenteroides subsp. cremoris]